MINQKSLREQVYEFLRTELHKGEILPGSSFNLSQMSQQLGVSKTPLRDALLQLEVEGFVTISPRRGVYVNTLTLDDIRHCYEIVGALETAAILSVFNQFKDSHIEEMRNVNTEISSALDVEDFERYYRLNIDFHNAFLKLSGNEPLRRIITPMKQRLYDFPMRGYIKEWEERNCNDHEGLIDAIQRGDRASAETVWRDVHWSFSAQEKFIRRFYLFEEGKARFEAAGKGRMQKRFRDK